jgi:Sel1 repeat
MGFEGETDCRKYGNMAFCLPDRAKSNTRGERKKLGQRPVSYDLLAWKQRPDSPMAPAQVYAFLSEDVEVPDLEDLDLAALEADLETRFPTWRNSSSFACEFCTKWLSFNVPHSSVERLVPQLVAFAKAHDLTLFEPEAEDVSASEARHGRRMARSARAQQLRQIREAEVADLRQRAESGDLKAQLDLANRLAFGDGLRKNAKQAFQWYQRAATAGSVDAMFNLAACLQYGDGVRPDVHEAIRWYQRAAGQDKVYATFALGEIYLGFGPVARDNAQSEAYFKEALAHGHPDARAALGLLRKPQITLEIKKRALKFWNPRA